MTVVRQTWLMDQALCVADSSPTLEVPVGAVIANSNGQIVAKATNSVQIEAKLTSHAEIIALESLGMKFLKDYRNSLVMAVTLEPCPMCAWAIRSAGIKTLIYGSRNPDYGAAGSFIDLLRDGRFSAPVEVIGAVNETKCNELMQRAFAKIRNNSGR